MKKIVILTLFLYSLSFAQEKYEGQTIGQILELQEDEIDLGIACLILAKDAYPNINIQFFDHVINYMASRINQIAQGRTEPEIRIGAINTYLYQPGWWNDSLIFTYDLDDLTAEKKNNQFLNGYLASKKGSCITMPMLNIVFADRLGWPIKAVIGPKHYFARYVKKGFDEANIDATVGGGYVPDEHYMKNLGITEKALKNGVYLRTLSKKEYIASLLINNARHWDEREKNLEKAMEYTAKAIEIDSLFSAAYWNLGHYYNFMAKNFEREMKCQIYAAEIMFGEEAAHLKLKNSPLTRKNQPHFQNKMSLSPRVNLIPQNQIHDTFLNDFLSKQIQEKKKYSTPRGRQPGNEQPHELTEAINNIRSKYIPQIKEALARSRWYKSKAEDLGIVLKLPHEFFINQKESIEKFKKTSNY